MDTGDMNCDTAGVSQRGPLLIGDLSQEKLRIVEDTRKAGGRIFFIKIDFQPKTPAKSLKVMLIENKLNKLGEIIRLWPTVNEVEDDSQSFALFIIFCTYEEKEIVSRDVNVDCVEKIFIKQI
ncbi:MAG: hypothetical protein HY354_00490 [Planctomycetes bacterium]|nr:hypothetical protein [Planctomycetota bacterium]